MDIFKGTEISELKLAFIATEKFCICAILEKSDNRTDWDMFSNKQAGVLCQNLDSVQKFVAKFLQSDCSCDVCM